MSETYAFSGGFLGYSTIGTRQKMRFVGTWAAGEDWTGEFSSTLSGVFTLGKGNIAEQTFSCAFKLRNRMYLGFGSSFALSENGDVTLWEEQNPGAAVVPYLSQFGQQDSVLAFASLLGRLVVMGRQSSQLWSINADPSLLALEQTMDNAGTRAPLTVKSIGDLDVLYLDDTGLRSLRAKENVLNAYVDDVGTPIDLIIRSALVGYDPSVACGVVEPTTKQYWCFVNGTIYVLSRYKGSEILAWSTYLPTAEPPSSTIAASSANYQPPGIVGYTVAIGSWYKWIKAGTAIELRKNDASVIISATGLFQATETTVFEVGTSASPVLSSLYLAGSGVTFTPTKMVVYGGQVYIRASNNKIYRYGGSDNNTFDSCQKTVELPWLDMKSPSERKQLQGVDAAIKGHWKIETSADPTQTVFKTCVDRGSQTAPSAVGDSTFDKGRFSAVGNGTHFKVKLTSYTEAAVRVSKLSVIYRDSNLK